jgi:hypothetical protein
LLLPFRSRSHPKYLHPVAQYVLIRIEFSIKRSTATLRTAPLLTSSLRYVLQSPVQKTAARLGIERVGKGSGLIG